MHAQRNKLVKVTKCQRERSRIAVSYAHHPHVTLSRQKMHAQLNKQVNETKRQRERSKIAVSEAYHPHVHPEPPKNARSAKQTSQRNEKPTREVENSRLRSASSSQSLRAVENCTLSETN